MMLVISFSAWSGGSAGMRAMLYYTAYCLDRDGHGDFALALLEKAPKAAKARADPWILQGTLYARAGKLEAAVDALRAATDREPGSERAWKSLAALYRRQNLSSFAASCEERAREAASRAARPAAARAAGEQSAPRAGEGLADADARSRRGKNR